MIIGVADEAGRVIFDIAPGAELAGGDGNGRRFATGDARGLTDAEPLNLAHPLVRAAIADARAWPGGVGRVVAPARRCSGPRCDGRKDWRPRGGAGRLRRVRAGAAADRGGVVDGVPIDPSVAARIVRLRATDSQAVGVTVDPHELDDALDEAMFIDQRETEKREQKHFERAIGQLERFVDDKVLVCRRERASIAEKLRSAKASA